MIFTPRLQKALNIAHRQHDGQRRKGLPDPYIVHPVSVMLIVSEYLRDEDALIAALMHDVIEDTKGYSYTDMSADFGPAVARLVKELSEDKSLPWRERKEHHLAALANASETALIITTADKIHNLNSFAEAWLSKDETAISGLRDMAQRSRWYFEIIRQIIADRLPTHPILKRFDEAWSQASPFFAAS